MAFRPIPVLHAFLDNQGTPLAGGSVLFYEAGTTTPLNVFGESALTTNLGASLTLDSAGRLATYPWAGEAVYVVVKDSDGVVVDEADHVSEEGATGVAFPSQTGNSGKFLTTDGSALSFDDVRQVPDPTGNANKVLSTDGESLIWITKPADGAAGADATNVTGTTTGLKVDNFAVLCGSDTAPSSGSETTSKTVTFATPFTTAPVHISLTVTNITVASGVALVAHSITNISTTGFTVNFNIADRHFVDGSKIINAVPFTYAAFGVRAS